MKPNSFSGKGQRGAASSWVFVGFALVALFFLLTEHRAHLYGWLPYLLLAACPLMHLFHGHGGHGGHGSRGTDQEPRRRDETQEPNPPSNTDVPPRARHHH